MRVIESGRTYADMRPIAVAATDEAASEYAKSQGFRKSPSKGWIKDAPNRPVEMLRITEVPEVG